MALPLDSPIWFASCRRTSKVALSLRPLSTFRNWDKQTKAIPNRHCAEAAIRRRLERWGMIVEPNEALTGKCGGPDFRCSCSSGGHFYVEVTCDLRSRRLRRRSGMGAGFDAGASFPVNVWGMVEAVFNKCQNKAPQCGGLDGPALVAVCTFHFQAAMTWSEESANRRIADRANEFGLGH